MHIPSETRRILKGMKKPSFSKMIEEYGLRYDSYYNNSHNTKDEKELDYYNKDGYIQFCKDLTNVWWGNIKNIYANKNEKERREYMEKFYKEYQDFEKNNKVDNLLNNFMLEKYKMEMEDDIKVPFRFQDGNNVIGTDNFVHIKSKYVTGIEPKKNRSKVVFKSKS